MNATSKSHTANADAKMNTNGGFTLVELLVVMVIVTATTTLLISGFSITWKNFERLSQRDLLMNSNVVGERWLRESVHEAVLYHPGTPMFFGDAQQLEFTTLNTPWLEYAVPSQIRWQILPQAQSSSLVLSKVNSSSTSNEPSMPVLQNLGLNSRFEYLQGNSWLGIFESEDAELPRAIRIVSDDGVVFFASLARPGKAKVPPEMATFGAYEFGG